MRCVWVSLGKMLIRHENNEIVIKKKILSKISSTFEEMLKINAI